ncbi:MAG: hypothetical protein HQL70_04070 [Magnetococcales bacterium]|nr:hypothetical protein [Magnetococcales bacterium]
MKVTRWIFDRVIRWLIKERPALGLPLCNFRRIRSVIKPGDVVLVEGRSKASRLIKIATHSSWSHAAICIGSLDSITDLATRRLVSQHYDGPPHRLLIIEALMDRGVVVSDMQNEYGSHHIRICRANGLAEEDNVRVIRFVANHLGCQYDFRYIVDLFRFLSPFKIFPLRWGSRLYWHYTRGRHKAVCSSMLARAFMTVSFPIIPVLEQNSKGELVMYRRNFRTMAPRDFDVSPYFDIVKYPLLNEDDLTDYRNLPWDHNGMVCNAYGDCFIPEREGEDSGATIGWNSARNSLGVITGKLSDVVPHNITAFKLRSDDKKQKK